MLRMSITAALAVAGFVAAAPATLAQTVTTTSAMVDNVKITGARAAPASTAAPVDTTGNVVNTLQGAHPAMPTLNSPPAGDAAN
jgi:hypothetical protein